MLSSIFVTPQRRIDQLLPHPLGFTAPRLDAVLGQKGTAGGGLSGEAAAKPRSRKFYIF